MARSYARGLVGRGLFAVCGAAIGVMAGCDREEPVRAYQAPKEVVVTSAAPQPAPAVSAVPTWTVPAGWKELPAEQMRFAAFAVAPDHPDVVLTVVPLGAEAGGLAANVARWQGQLGLPPSPPEEANKLVSHADVNGVHVDTVDLLGAEAAAPSGKPRQRMLAAVMPAGGRTWFFKLTGRADAVEAQKSNFDAFVRSVKFVPAPASAANPTGAATAAAGDTRNPAPPAMATGELPSGAPGRLEYAALPPGWTATAKNDPPRVASFKVEASGQSADLVVTKFPGTAIGTFADNVNRWRGQIGLAPVADAGGYVPKVVTLGGEQWAIVDVVGEDKPGAPGSAQRILVGMATPGGTTAREIWFFKLQGPSGLVADQRPAFEKFLETVKFAPAN